MDLRDTAVRRRLAQCLAPAFGVDMLEVRAAELLPGGAIQENWALDLSVQRNGQTARETAVLRTDSPSGVAISHSRPHEYRLIRAAWEAGVTVPEPFHVEEGTEALGRPFFLTRLIPGTALGMELTADTSLGGPRDALVARLGRELAAIHRITPATHAFAFLDPPPTDPAMRELDRMRTCLDALGDPRPALEWGLRWCWRNRPAPGEVVMAHHDFRTGNYMVNGDGLTGILDWEFADWSDPHEDIGWFCARCWRFARPDREAGGIGARKAFYRAYEVASGRRIEPDRVAFWEVFAHLRWAVIALQQAARYLTGGERTLDLGLTGYRLPELEYEILRMTAPGADL